MQKENVVFLCIFEREYLKDVLSVDEFFAREKKLKFILYCSYLFVSLQNKIITKLNKMREQITGKYKVCLTVCLVMLLLLTCFSCSKDGDTIYVQEPDDVPSTAPLVIVVYDPDALGDRSYNDLICRGVEEAALKSHVRTMQLSPSSRQEGLTYLETFFQQMSTQQDTIRRLLVVTSPAYDDFVRRNNRRLEGNPYADLLYLETSTPLDGKGSTLYLPYYGAMYEAGAYTPYFGPFEVLLVGANRENESVADAMQGFLDGFSTDYFPPMFPDKIQKRTVVEYLGEHQDEGFSVSDSIALQLMMKYEWDRDYSMPMVVPVCGGAGQFFLRMAEMVRQFYCMGVDVQQLSCNCHHSVVKHIDRALDLCVSQWLSAEGMSKHQVLGLASGYTEVIIHPVLSIFTMNLADLSVETRQAIHQEAIRKEEEYGR